MMRSWLTSWQNFACQRTPCTASMSCSRNHLRLHKPAWRRPFKGASSQSIAPLIFGCVTKVTSPGRPLGHALAIASLTLCSGMHGPQYWPSSRSIFWHMAGYHLSLHIISFRYLGTALRRIRSHIFWARRGWTTSPSAWKRSKASDCPTSWPMWVAF